MTFSRRSKIYFAVCAACAALIVSACSKKPEVMKRDAIAAGDRFVAEHKLSEAVIEYRKALRVDPRAGDVELKLGRAYLALGDGLNAANHLVRAADFLHTNAEAQIAAGQVLLLAGGFAEAKDRATNALELDPGNVDGQILMGNALAGLKDLDGAIVQVEQAINNDPRRLMSYANLGALEFAKGNQKAAEQAFRRAVAASPNAAIAHLGLANYLWAAARLTEAEAELRTAVKLEPKSGGTNRALATFLTVGGRSAEAEPFLRVYAENTNDESGWLTLADFYRATGRNKDARTVLEPLAAKPEGIQATLRLAMIDYSEGHQDGAHAKLQGVLKRNPKHEMAKLIEARLLLSEKKTQPALNLAKQVVANNPNSAPGRHLIGLILETSGDSDAAIQAFKQVLAINPSAVESEIELARISLANGDTDTAIEFARQAIRGEPGSVVAHLLLAKALTAKGDLAAAQAELLALQRAVPGSAEVQSALGAMYLHQHDLTRAEATYRRALDIQPRSVDALAGLTEIDIESQKGPGAASRLEERLKADPNNARLQYLAAMTFKSVGNQQRAETAYRRALELDPGNLDAYGDLARLYVSERRLDDAKQQFEELAKRDKKPVAATTMIGMLLELQNKPGDARVHYEQALAMDPQAPIAANNLAWAYAQEGKNLDVALQLAQTAKAGRPDRHEIDDTLGWVYYKKGLSSLAIASLRRAVTAQQDNPIYQYHLGAAYAQSGDKELARKTLDRALNMSANFSGADDARKILQSVN
jgi:tetratricopeptide (TPR) repeat protein